MATLATQSIARTGTAITHAAAASGDKLACGEGMYLSVKNGDASSKTITLAVPGNDKFGNAKPDLAVVVAAGAQTLIPVGIDFKAPSDGLCALSYSATTSVTVAALKA